MGPATDTTDARPPLEHHEALAVLDALGVAVSVHGVAGELVYANRLSRKLLADLAELMTEERPVGAVQWGAIREDGTPLEAHELPVEVTRTTGIPVRDALVGFAGILGDVRWLRITTRRMPGTHDVPCTVVATFTDVTPAA
ncbi:hypothetical protein [Patulibacter minatonensis]|uniref:hypothetical protein n=1 Tax=Patulibacter minatonensis TaxID=298163 RepID=UPI00047CE554|nr:hypothetical protein [Patulibacter minatonensis]